MAAVLVDEDDAAAGDPDEAPLADAVAVDADPY